MLISNAFPAGAILTLVLELTRYKSYKGKHFNDLCNRLQLFRENVISPISNAQNVFLEKKHVHVKKYSKQYTKKISRFWFRWKSIHKFGKTVYYYKDVFITVIYVFITVVSVLPNRFEINHLMTLLSLCAFVIIAGSRIACFASVTNVFYSITGAFLSSSIMHFIHLCHLCGRHFLRKKITAICLEACAISLRQWAYF